MSQPDRNSRGLRDGELDILANDCVRFLINKSLTKVPIKRGEILKFLNKTRDGCSRSTNEILAEANRKLNDVYGFKLVEMNSKSQYILVLNEEHPSPKKDENSQVHLLLIVTLSHIFMNGGRVKEDAMWRFLEKAGLMTNGDAATQKILTHQFTKELYLNFIKTGELDNPKFVFEWGPRADAELSKMFLLKKIGGAFNRPPEHWYEQNKEALQSDGSENP